MRINQNVAALNAWRNLTITDGAMGKALERLSSGMRINKAADDAAGLAISEKMRSQVRGLNQAVRNAQDAISLIQTAEGALQETQAILQRMRELAVQAASDTATYDDRLKIQREVDALSKEITRISNTSEFNTKNLLAGGFSGQKFFIGANAGQDISLSINAMDAFTMGVTANKGTTLLDGNGLSAPVLTGTVGTGTYTVSTTNDPDQVVNKVASAGILDADSPNGLDPGSYSVRAEAGVRVTDHASGLLKSGAAGGTAGLDMGAYGAKVYNLVDYIGGAGLEDATGDAIFAAGGVTNFTGATIGVTYTLEFDDTADELRLLEGATVVATIAYNNAGGAHSFSWNGGANVLDIAAAGGLDGGGNASTTFGVNTYAVGTDATVDDTDAAYYTNVSMGSGNVVLYDDAGTKQHAALTLDTTKYSANVTGATGLGNRNAFATVEVEVFTQAWLLQGSTIVGAKTEVQPGGIYNVGDVSGGTYARAQFGTAANLPGLGNVAQTLTFDVERGDLNYTLKNEDANTVDTATTTAGATSVTFNAVGLSFTKDPISMSGLSATIDIVSDNSRAATTTASGGIQAQATVEKGILVNTQANASGAISVLDDALKTVSSQRAILGAIQNRLEHTIANLTVASENLAASESRVRDVDMAAEMANFTRAQILLQAGTAMMAQANARPQAVLQLLR